MMKLPRLARNTILYIAAPVLQRGVYFLLIPILTRYLTPAEYGAWGYINVTATMLGTLVPLGLTSTYYHALKSPKGWPVPPEHVRSAAIRTGLVLVVAAALLAWPIVRIVDLGIPQADITWALVLSATAAGYIVQISKRRYQMLEQPRPYATIELTTGLGIAAATLAGVVVFGWGVVGMAFGLAVGTTLGLVLSLGPVWPDLRRPVDRIARTAALAFGLPLFVHTGAAIILQYVDRFMLERLSTMDQLGLYSLAGQLGTAMVLVTTATNLAYLPFVYRRVDSHPELVRRAERYAALFFVFAGISGALLAPLFIGRLVDARYAGSVWPAQILMLAGIFHGFYYLMVARLLLQRRTVAIAAATITAAIINVVLNLAWIPDWHSVGAAWATLVGEVILFAGMWWFARGAYHRPRTPETEEVLPDAPA